MARQRTCPDCRRRGSWGKTNPDYPCPDCYAVRLKRHAEAKARMDRCAKRVENGSIVVTCRRSDPDACASCAEYFATLDRA